MGTNDESEMGERMCTGERSVAVQRRTDGGHCSVVEIYSLTGSRYSDENVTPPRTTCRLPSVRMSVEQEE